MNKPLTAFLVALAVANPARAGWGGCTYPAGVPLCINTYLSLVLLNGDLTGSVDTSCSPATTIAHTLGAADIGYNLMQWNLAGGDALPAGAGTCINLGPYATAVTITPTDGSCGTSSADTSGNTIAGPVAISQGDGTTALIVSGCHATLNAQIPTATGDVQSISEQYGGMELRLSDGYRLGDSYRIGSFYTIYDGDQTTGPDGITWDDSTEKDVFVYAITINGQDGNPTTTASSN